MTMDEGPIDDDGKEEDNGSNEFVKHLVNSYANDEEERYSNIAKVLGKKPKNPNPKSDSNSADMKSYPGQETLKDRVTDSRKKEAEKNILYLPVITFAKLQGKAMQNYVNILKSMNLNADLGDSNSILVDKRGFSPEISEKLGENYMDDLVIIASPLQKKASLLSEYISEELLDGLYKNASSLIDSFADKEALCGITETNIAEIVPAGGDLVARIKIDTGRKIVERVENVKEKLNNLGKNDNLLDNKYLEDIVSNVKETGESGYNVAEFMNTPLENSNAVVLDAFKISHENADFYGVTSNRSMILNENLIFYFSDKETYPNAINANEEDVFRILMENKLIYASSDKIREKMANADNSELKVLTELNEHPNYIGAFKKLSPELKFEVSMPMKYEDIVNELMARASGDIFAIYKHASEQFKKTFGEAEDKAKILGCISSRLSYKNEHNPKVNEWLRENYPKEVEKAGLKFASAL